MLRLLLPDLDTTPQPYRVRAARATPQRRPDQSASGSGPASARRIGKGDSHAGAERHAHRRLEYLHHRARALWIEQAIRHHVLIQAGARDGVRQRVARAPALDGEARKRLVGGLEERAQAQIGVDMAAAEQGGRRQQRCVRREIHAILIIVFTVVV